LKADVPSEATKAWHATPAEAVINRLGTDLEGLSADEAAKRLAQYGPNRLRPARRRGPIARFLLQFHNVLIYVLLGASVVTAALAHWVDTGVILGVVLINALIGYVQEGKAERALEAIRNMLSLSASVMRDGRKTTLPADALVPGDIVFLQSGDKVPADLRIVHVKNLQIQEAVLTGESIAVEKKREAVADEALLGDRSSMAYSGTLVTYGQATGVVVATGTSTEIGRISSMLAEVQTLTTPLLQQIELFGRWLTLAIIIVAVSTFGFGILIRDYAPSDMFLAAVGLAVAAIPEGLPAIMTITLAIGVQRMARRNAIIRRLPAVETLGSVSVICSDKTGTLTRNEMTVQAIATSRHLFEVTGVGYLPAGELTLDGIEASLDHRPLLSEMTRGALLCSDAGLRQTDTHWVVDGDPTEGALVVVAMKAGWEPEFEAKNCPRTDVIPFESEHRFMATVHHDHEGNGYIYVKGAPERILEMCDQQRGYLDDEPLELAYWHARMEEIAGRGQRILALAAKPALNSHRELRFKDVENGLVLVGLFGLTDPPRPEAIEAVARCQAAGIKVKMITGDHAATARAIAAQLGLDHGTGVLTGHQLDSLDDQQLRSRIEQANVFARTSPQHKLRLVETLQAANDVVAMTGDGVNDAPALKRAGVGVAMGVKGTEAAKEAAEMVLADDDFASIAHAVEEGRTVYDNLKKSIMFILPTNVGEALTIVMAIALGRLLPLTAAQILWVNMITAVTLALSLAFEPAESDVMSRPPRRRDEPILSRLLLWRIVLVSLVLVAGTFGMFLWQRYHGASIEAARTVAVNTLVMFEVFYLFNARFGASPSLNRTAGESRAKRSLRATLL
jgi:magnesium-transporting ATPase (P-type)